MEIALPVDEVTLMEDRARVVRRAAVALAPGRHLLLVPAIAPVLVDKTLAGRARGGRVTQVRVVRRVVHLREDAAETVRSIEDRLEAMRRAYESDERALARTATSLALVGEALQRTIDEAVDDAAWSRLDLEPVRRAIDELEERERALHQEHARREHDLSERMRAITALEARAAALRDPSTERRANLEIDVVVDASGAIELEVEYVVPAALWRPCHRAVLTATTLHFETEACVWQQTGEAWKDAQLRFSPQRPSLGTTPPRLETDRLASRRKNDVLEVQRREQIVEDTGLGAALDQPPELPGIDDAGETLEFSAAHRLDVPSDGRPNRVPLFSFAASASIELFSAPELTQAVIAKSVLDNEGRRPLLAGPVELVRDGGYVGRTSVRYIAPGERFELGWGPDPGLRVHREVEDLPPETNLLRNWQITTKKVTVRVSNLSPVRKPVALVERVPVSEIEKVQVEVDRERTTRGVSQDSDGFLRFALDLAPFAHETIEVRYAVRRHADVVGL